MTQTINIGIVGCGYWGPNLVRNFNAVPDCRVTRVCDTAPQRLAHIRKLYPSLETSTAFAELLAGAQVDAVVVATPAPRHYELARQSLEAGKHVFIEKPMATSSRDCADLVKLAAHKKRTLMVGHTFLYSAPVRKIKELVDAGDLGTICYISSRRLNLGLFQKDINVVWDLAPHDISVICYVMGQKPCAVNCQGHAHVTPNVEDVTNMTLQFPSGVFAIVQNSWLDPRKVREMTIVGTRRMIVYDDLEPLQKIRIYDVRVEIPPHYDTFAQFQFAYHYGDMYAPRLDQDEALKTECQHFIDCIRTGNKPLSSGEEGCDLVCVLEAASASLRQAGARVDVHMHGSALDAGRRTAPAAPSGGRNKQQHRAPPAAAGRRRTQP